MSLVVDLPPECLWADITLELEDPDAPLTFAKPDGVGALQFSGATYTGGAIPRASVSVLREMLLEFARTRSLGAPSEMVLEQGPLTLVAASFQTEAFIRVWYLTDGANFALATYNCEPENGKFGEVADCEELVRAVRFL